MGAAVERLAAHIGRRFSGDAELEQHLAVERYLTDEVAAVIGQEHCVIRRHMDAVRTRILSLAPRAQETARPVEHHHRVLAAIENINIVVAVDADAADFLERPALGQFRPIGINTVFEVTASDDHQRFPPIAYLVTEANMIEPIKTTAFSSLSGRGSANMLEAKPAMEVRRCR